MQGAALAALGAAPLAAGALLPADGDTGLVCPLLTVTGIPCPFCGGTRAFAHAGHGDLAGVLDHHAVWVLYAVLALAAAVVLLVRRRPAPDLVRPRVLAALLAPAWAWALVQQAT